MLFYSPDSLNNVISEITTVRKTWRTKLYLCVSRIIRNWSRNTLVLQKSLGNAKGNFGSRRNSKLIGKEKAFASGISFNMKSFARLTWIKWIESVWRIIQWFSSPKENFEDWLWSMFDPILSILEFLNFYVLLKKRSNEINTFWDSTLLDLGNKVLFDDITETGITLVLSWGCHGV